MTKTYRRRDNLIEDRCLKLQSKELGIMWEQSRIQIPLDGGKVERVVLKSRMIAHDNNGKYSESGEQREVFSLTNRDRLMDNLADFAGLGHSDDEGAKS